MTTTELPNRVSDEALLSFRSPEHSVWKDALAVWNYRGDGTNSGDERIRRAIGEEAYEQYHWDTVVSNGRVMLVMPRRKHPLAIEHRSGLNIPARVWWCVSQITANEDVEPAGPSITARVHPDIHESLKALPDVVWMRVRRVNYFHYGRGRPKKKSEPPPDNMAFFRFRGGVGIASASA